MKYLTRFAILAAATAPLIASAQFLDTLRTLVQQFGQIVSLLLPIVFALAVLAFFYGIFLYVFSASGEKKKDGRNIMLWFLVAIFVMASLWGIVRLAQLTLGIQQGAGQFQVPGVQGMGGGGGNNFFSPCVNETDCR